MALICRSGSRAAEAETALSDAGLENLHVLDGGMDAWQSHGGRVRHSDHAWDLERQVRLVAGGIALTGVLRSTVFPKAKWLSAGIGAGLVSAAHTDSCMMAKLLSTLPFNRGTRGDLDRVLARLRG